MADKDREEAVKGAEAAASRLAKLLGGTLVRSAAKPAKAKKSKPKKPIERAALSETRPLSLLMTLHPVLKDVEAKAEGGAQQPERLEGLAKAAKTQQSMKEYSARKEAAKKRKKRK